MKAGIIISINLASEHRTGHVQELFVKRKGLYSCNVRLMPLLSARHCGGYNGEQAGNQEICPQVTSGQGESDKGSHK